MFKIMILTILFTSNSFAIRTVIDKYKDKIATSSDVKKGQVVFNELSKCTKVKVMEKFSKKSISCIKSYIIPGVKDKSLQKFVMWFNRMKKIQKLKKCDLDTLTNYPSTLDRENHIILCLDYEVMSKKRRSLIYFQMIGETLYFRDARS